ncbi:serine-rich adhesin for platelets-like [Metopolophium dirhodum]|uniref:serine-rich adhesin for platelets-like n=1 Tax=Metopolophium dirhodum TaxID=44670 RepID=UPI00298F7DAF|nr:serine-rich adhesin for platelets-like [Metopolophium dirhodum]
MYFRMILFSYTFIVSILEFVVAVQADTKSTIDNNELSLSLSNEQVTEYKYERTIQSAAAENNQDQSITTNINTEFVQKIHSSNEHDLNVTDSSDLNSTMNMDVISEINMLNHNEASLTNDYGTQMSTHEISNTDVKIEGDTAFMSPNGIIDFPNYDNPTNPNGDLTDKQDGQAYDSNGNKISDNSIMNSYQSSSYYGYNIQNIVDQNGEIPTSVTSSPGANGSPPNVTPTSSNRILNSSLNSKQKAATSSTTTSTSNSNGTPPSSSPKSPTGDSTGKQNGQDYDSNGNKISDTSIMNSYQSSSYYGYNFQNIADVNGEIPTTATSSPGANGSPSIATPTYPNGNLKSVSNDAAKVNVVLSELDIPLTYPIGVPINMNTGIPYYPHTSSPNYGNGAPKSKVNGGTTSTTTSTSNSNGTPSSSSPKSPTGDSTGKQNGQDYDSNGNKMSDTSIMNSYQTSSYYGYNIQNIVDQNGEIPTSVTSSPGSNGSPPNVTPTSSNRNLNSSSTSKQKAATSSTTTSTSNSNGSPSSSTPKSLTGDSKGKQIAQDYDSNGNMISDTSIMNSYQSSSYYGYNIQNIADVNGEIPTTATSSPGANSFPSIATPTFPNGNLKSVSNDAAKVNVGLSELDMPLTYPIGVPINMNTGVPHYPHTSSPNYGNGAPKSKVNGGTTSTTTSTSNSNGTPSSSSPKSPTGDSTGKQNGQDYDSNGNKISDTSIMNSYQSSSYYGYNIQNIADVNGEIPTTATSSPGSNGSPPNVTPTSSNRILNSSLNSKQKAATSSTTTSTSNSNGTPSSSSPKSPTGDSTGKQNGQDYDSNGNKISDTSIMNSYQSSSYYGYNFQNIADVNGEIPTTATSSPGANGSPSIATPTYPNGNLKSVSNDAAKVNVVLSELDMPLTYPIGVPINMNTGVPHYPHTSSPNFGNGAPKSKVNGGTTSTTTSTSNSNGTPSSSSPKSPTGDSIGKQNGQDYDSNGNKISDTSIMNSYQSSSYYGYNFQNIADVNGEIPTTATSSPGANGSPSIATPTYPNGNLKSVSNDAAKVNVVLSELDMPLTYPIEVPINMNTGVPNYPHTSSPNYGNGAPKSKVNGGTTSTTTSTSNSNGTPSSSSPKSPTGDSTGKQNGQDYDSNGNKMSDTSIMNSYQSSSYYGYNFQNISDVNGDIPTTATSLPDSNGSPSSATLTSTNRNLNRALNTYLNGGTPPTSKLPANSNGSPSSSYPISPYGDSTNKPNVQDYDSNGNKLSDNSFMNGYQTSNYYGYIQNTADQDTIFNYPPETSEYLNNQLLQNSVSTFNLQNTATPDQFGIMPSNSLTMPNGKYDEVKNDGVNIPLLNENGDIYNNYFYGDNSVKTVRSLNGNFDTQNDDNYNDGYMGIVPFDDGNMQGPSNEPYAPNLNARYENSQLQYGLNQNPPPYRGYPYMGNDITPFDTNIYPDISPQISVMNSDLYNYNNIDGIEYDQTKIGIEETSPENIQLSMSDLDTFSSNQISQTSDSFIDTDLTSDHLVYDSVDADNRDLEIIDSNYMGQVNENNVYRGQGFNGYNNIQSINVPEYNQFNGDYTTTYLSNLGTYETSSSNTGTDAAVDGPEGPYLTPLLLNSNYNLPTSSDLNKQIADSNSLIVDNVQLNGYLYRKTDTSNVNTQVEGSPAVIANGSPMNDVDNRFESIQTTDLSKNNELGVGQNVYGVSGQVIGRIYKPSGIVKTKNRHKYSGSSSYSSPNDSEFSDGMHAIGHGIKRAARDAIGNVHDNIKDAYDTTKAVGKAVGNIAGNAASKAADGIEQTAKTPYQGSKDAVKAVKNSVGEAADDVEETAKTAYQGSKDAANDMENAFSDAADDVEETA